VAGAKYPTESKHILWKEDLRPATMCIADAACSYALALWAILVAGSW